MTVAGIDISSFAVDVVLLDDDTDAARACRFELVGRTPFDRTRYLRYAFPSRSFWEDAGVYLLGFEDPYSRANHTAKALGLVTGGVAALLPLELAAIQLPPAEWKSEFVGRGNATKDEVRAATQAHGFPAAGQHISPDAHDAYGIAWATRALNQRAIQRGAA